MYHIKLLERANDGEWKVNITEEELLKRYVEPYKYGETIVINGTTIEPKEIHRVLITKSEGTIDSRVREIEQHDKANRSAYDIFKSVPEWRAIDEFEDVTDNFINVAPGSQKRSKNSKSEGLTNMDRKKVFIVHGHDIELKNDVELFLRSINLEPVVLHRQLDEGMTVIEKFEKHADVSYAIVLLTPDDIGYPLAEGEKPEAERNICFRARQNVVLEFGYFIGKLGRKNVCCVYKSGVELPSDLNGLIYKPVQKTIEEVGMFIMKELKNAGLDVKFE